MIKKLVVSLGMLMMMFGLFFESEAFAADFGPASWRTEDGKYELTLNTTSSANHVLVSISNVYNVNYNSGYATPQSDYSPLSVRLCNVSTGNCTSLKKFDDYGAVYFYYMKPGIYYVDIIDSWSSYYFKGTISAVTYTFS